MDEYPKLLYKGAGTADYVSVANDSEEQAQRAAGYGEYRSEYAIPAEGQVITLDPPKPYYMPALPSASDLDAVAAEQKATEATQGDADAVRN